MSLQPHLHVVREGSGPVMVLSHALGCDLSMWDGVVERLKDHFTLLRYDHRGHGLSDAPPGPYTMSMLADDAARLIEAHAAGPVHFVGLSMGGMTAQALAAAHPQWVKSIVVANAADHYDEAARTLWHARVKTVLHSGVGAVSDGAMQRWFTPEFRAGGGAQLVARCREQLEKTDATAYAASCEAVAGIDFRTTNAAIRCPALVIGGVRDEATPPAASRAIAAGIAESQLRMLDAAHLSAVEQPQAFADLLAQFAGGLD